MNDNNLRNFYTNDCLESIDEISTCDTPTIIIDHGSDPEVNAINTNYDTNNDNNDNNNHMNNKIVTKGQIKIKPQLENTETSLVKYLSPPPMRSRRSPENGSVASTTSSTSISIVLDYCQI